MRSLFAVVLVGFVMVGALGCGGESGGGSSRAQLWGDGALLDPPLSADVSDSLRKMHTVLAWVGERPVTAGDVFRHMQSTTTPENAVRYMNNPDILQVALSALMDQLVWGEIARQEGYTFTPAERREVLTTEALVLATRYVADVVEAAAMPSDESVESWYQEHQTNFLRPPRVGVRHILVSAESEAQDILSKAKAGADFSELAAQYSLDEDSRTLSGALGFLSEGGELPGIGHSSEVENTLLPMKEGEMVVMRTQRGWHVFRIDRREDGFLVPLAEVRQAIAQRLLTERFSTVYNEYLTAARERANASIVEGAFEELTGMGQNADRLLALALEHPDSPGRIELLRRITFDFATSERAPEAQFRISYEYLVEIGDKNLARKGLTRLQKRYPESPWRVAGDYLLDHINDAPDSFGSVEAVLTSAGVTLPR